MQINANISNHADGQQKIMRIVEILNKMSKKDKKEC